MFVNLFNRFSYKCRVHSHRYPKDNGYIYSETAFREIMVRERARTDRTRHGFAFVVIELPDDTDAPEVKNRIIDIVGDWLRVTDQAGWLKQNQTLAVLLYACSEKDARGFAKRLAKSAEVDDLQCRIYSYPGILPEFDPQQNVEIDDGK